MTIDKQRVRKLIQVLPNKKWGTYLIIFLWLLVVFLGGRGLGLLWFFLFCFYRTEVFKTFSVISQISQISDSTNS